MNTERKEGRPGELEETVDLDVPQDPGVPGIDEHEAAAEADRLPEPGEEREAD